MYESFGSLEKHTESNETVKGWMNLTSRVKETLKNNASFILPCPFIRSGT